MCLVVRGVVCVFVFRHLNMSQFVLDLLPKSGHIFEFRYTKGKPCDILFFLNFIVECCPLADIRTRKTSS